MTYARSLAVFVAALASSAAACGSSSLPPNGAGADASGQSIDDSSAPSPDVTVKSFRDATPSPASDAASSNAEGPPRDDAVASSNDAAGIEASAGAPSPLSYMIGIKTNGVPTGPAKVEAWLGRPLDVAGTTITTTSYIGSGKPYTTASGAYPLLEVSFPLLSIFNESNHLTDMAMAAAGGYDATYTEMAEALAAWKNPLLSVRIGWEFNGNWYAWSEGKGTNATVANYVAAFKRAATIIKAKNPHVLIQWCMAWGQPDPTPYWPGAYDKTTNPGGVDVVSMDFYQANISEYNDPGHTSTWAMAQSGTGAQGAGPIVLDWMITFAQTNHVKVALSEYGAGEPSSKGIDTGPGLDDGTWTADSIAWLKGLPAGLLLWSNWSDDEPADDIATSGANPAEQAAWIDAWRETRFHRHLVARAAAP